MSREDRLLWAQIYKSLKLVQSALAMVMSAVAHRARLNGAGELLDG